MKTKYMFICAITAIALALPVLGQQPQKTKTMTGISDDNMWSKMGKPIYESTVDTLSIKVWVLTQAEHQKMMKTMGQDKQETKDSLRDQSMMGRMNDSSMKMDMTSRQGMMEGTHVIMLVITNTKTNREIVSGSAILTVTSPTQKVSSLDLKSMKNCFGSSLTLTEKGKYLFTINSDTGGGFKTKQFEYVVN